MEGSLLAWDMCYETTSSRGCRRLPTQRVWGGESESGWLVHPLITLEITNNWFMIIVDLSIVPLNVGANTNNTALVVGYVPIAVMRAW